MPLIEFVQPSTPCHYLITGPQVKVIGIAQDDFRANRGKVVGSNRLHRTDCAYRHENGSMHYTVSRVQFTATGRTILSGYFKGSRAEECFLIHF
jgi:hypothetical protein